MSEVNVDSAADCNRDESPARQSSTTTVPLLNTVLACDSNYIANIWHDVCYS